MPHTLEEQAPRTLPTLTGINPIQAYLLELYRELRQKKTSGASPTEITDLEEHISTVREGTGMAPGPARSVHTPPISGEDRKGVLHLMKSKDIPTLGAKARAPTTAQLDRWIRDMNNQFRLCFATDDTVERIMFTIAQIKYEPFHDIVDRAVNDDGSITTWAALTTKLRGLVEDPVLTRYLNYQKFWGIEWREGYSITEFYNHLTNMESRLEARPFTGQMTAEQLKISFVWSKTPEPIRIEMRRSGQLKDTSTWESFERAVRDAETAIQATATKPQGNTGSHTSNSNRNRQGKRQASQPEQSGSEKQKKQDRKSSHRRSHSPENPRRSNDPRKPQGNRSGSTRNEHWKNKKNSRESTSGTPKSENDKP